jgi:hypothetical protein
MAESHDCIIPDASIEGHYSNFVRSQVSDCHSATMLPGSLTRNDKIKVISTEDRSKNSEQEIQHKEKQPYCLHMILHFFIIFIVSKSLFTATARDSETQKLLPGLKEQK